MKTCEKFLLKMWLSSNTSNISIKYLLHRKMVSPILFQTIRLCISYAFEANLDLLKGQTGISILFIFININIKMHASPMLLICMSLNRKGVCNKIPSLKDIYHREFVKWNSRICGDSLKCNTSQNVVLNITCLNDSSFISGQPANFQSQAEFFHEI